MLLSRLLCLTKTEEEEENYYRTNLEKRYKLPKESSINDSCFVFN
jgi:hypothetical protein